MENTSKISKKELEGAEKRYQQLIERRNELNAEANSVREERDDINAQRKKLTEEMSEIRNKMKEISEELRTHKSARNEYQRKAKELIEMKKKRIRADRIIRVLTSHAGIFTWSCLPNHFSRD